MYISDIRAYKNEINSIYNSPDSFQHNKGLIKTHKYWELKKNGKLKKIQVYRLTNPAKDSIYKVFYWDNIDSDLYKTFYYIENKLVYAKVEIWNLANIEATYTREEYYKDGIIVDRIISEEDFNPKHTYRIEFSLFNDGSNYKKWLKD